MVRSMLEVIRIILLFFIVGGISYVCIAYLYIQFGIREDAVWPIAIALFLLLVRMYRNTWQFSGWYKGEKRKKLSAPVSQAIVFSEIGLFVLPIILDYWY